MLDSTPTRLVSWLLRELLRNDDADFRFVVVGAAHDIFGQEVAAVLKSTVW